MSAIPEITKAPENEETSAITASELTNPPTALAHPAEITKDEEQEAEATKAQNQQTISASTTPEKEKTSAAPQPKNPPTSLDNPAEIPQEEKATEAPTQQTMSIATSPENNETSTTPTITALPISPPTAPDNSAQTTNTQNQQTLSSMPEITAAEAIATRASPSKDDNLGQSTSTGNQETTSTPDTPEITPEEATATAITPPELDNSSQPTKTENQKTLPSSVPEITEEEKALPTDLSAQNTSEMTEKKQKCDQNEAPKADSAIVAEPSTETPKLESTTFALPPTETRNKKSPDIAPQTDKKTDPGASKKDWICLPLPGVSDRSKKKKLEPKKPALVQDSAITPSKDEPPEESTLVQPIANIPSKDATLKKPIIAQENTKISSKDELSKSITADMKYIEQESGKLSKYKEHVSSLLSDAAERFEELKKVGNEKELRELKKEVTKLKLQIPSKHKGDVEEKDPQKSQQGGISKIRQKIIPELVMKQMPQLHKSKLFESSSEVRDFEVLFDKLSVEMKLSLLCFSIFPENAIIKKRLMVYWWIAEGYVPPALPNDETRRQIENGKTAEEFADEYFEQLTKMGFIQPVNKNRSLSVGCYKMHPFVRLALIRITERAKFFHFDDEGMPTEKAKFFHFDDEGKRTEKWTFQACLMGRGLLDYQDLEKLHAVFNINETILDFRPEWLLKMNNLNILYLGGWKVSGTDHIEVEETNFLDGLSTMEHLRFFSLQGVSRIVELPDSISQLSSLMILDLRACHSLESIPEGISSLKNLTYLDTSECYMLEHMPKGLATLSNLKILKGFVVGEERGKNTCSLDDLAKLEKLIKLSIYTGLSEFPGDKDLNALQHFKVLKKLTIAWGGSALHTKSDNNIPKVDDGGQRKKEKPKDEQKKALTRTKTLGQTLKKLATLKGSAGMTSSSQLSKLEKLDLKSFPKAVTPAWLMSPSLKSLKKLYIRGGKFSDLGQYQNIEFQPGTQGHENDEWNVEILRLKYLTELEMDWRQLQQLFPNLIYLEKVNCPKLCFFPSDGYGVWINKEKLKLMQVRSQ